MPRLTNLEYLQNHLALHREWQNGAGVFVLLTPPEQVALHNFYEPSLTLSPLELIELRIRVTREQPSLPQRVGKAFAQIKPFLGTKPDLFTGTVSVSRGRRKNTLQVMSIESLVQPQIDVEKIVRALVLEAMDQAKHEWVEAKPLSPPLPEQPDDEDVPEQDRAA